MKKIQDAIGKIQRGVKERTNAGFETAEALESSSSSEPTANSRASETRPSEAKNELKYKGPEVSVEWQRLIGAGLLDPNHVRKHLSSEYRELKREVVETIGKGKESSMSCPNLITIASAGAGEGRSYLALNLAICLALHSDFNVVLVEADFLRPRLSANLEGASEKGLVDLMRDSSLDNLEVISPTNVPGLAFLSSGQVGVDTPDEVADEQAVRVFRDLSAQDPNRIIVFDTAPVLPSNNCAAWLAQLGQVLFVIKAGETTQNSASEALNKLGRPNSTTVVLNQVVGWRF